MIGIDIGGANLKVVDEDGIHIHYCPLWQEAPIRDLLIPYRHDQDTAVVMSGELADCFSSKAEGIAFIVSQVQEVFPGAWFYGTDGRFHSQAGPELAAANWLAMADLFRKEYPDSVLVDMGSTTTDIIPLNAFGTMVGQTDLTRLQQGYLVYSGLLRTHVATIIRSAVVNGLDTPVSTEYFASAGDAYVALGLIPGTLYTTDTADKKGTDRISCLRRLARVVCADLDEIGEEGALEIAQNIVSTQKTMVTTAVNRIVSRHNASRILVAGIGSGIAAGWVNGTDLAGTIGEYADALPAYAVRKVLARTR